MNWSRQCTIGSIVSLAVGLCGFRDAALVLWALAFACLFVHLYKALKL